MSDPERSPLLARNSVRFYTSDDVINDEDNTSEPEATRPGAGACRSWVSREDSDAEYMSSASRSPFSVIIMKKLTYFVHRSSRTLPNNAPAPFVYLGLLCAILAGLCFTSR